MLELDPERCSGLVRQRELEAAGGGGQVSRGREWQPPAVWISPQGHGAALGDGGWVTLLPLCSPSTALRPKTCISEKETARRWRC